MSKLHSTHSKSLYETRSIQGSLYSIWHRFHIDLPLVINILLLIAAGLLVLYSAGSQSMVLMTKQITRLSIAGLLMLVLAQIPPRKYYQWVPFLFGLGVVMLVAVLIIGHIGKGAQRWINLGFMRFQPSEFMKLVVPMMVARYLHDKSLPPRLHHVAISVLIFMVPMALTAKQPDLGTAIMIASSGAFVLLLAGLNWRWIASVGVLMLTSLPIVWHYLHTYQKERVLTFLNPERDPLGSGYHIIQSKIAIGSGGFLGKGWLAGTQSHLQFLPEHATDFIFAVCGEEFGFLGSLVLMILLLCVVARGLFISTQAQDTFSRLLAGSITLTFFFSFFVNIGMVSGILPVVGLPLPLVSYGGTSMVTILAGLGILMSVHTHRPLIGR